MKCRMSIQEYEQALQGKIILPTDELYEEKGHIFNSAIQSKPAAIILCENVWNVLLLV